MKTKANRHLLSMYISLYHVTYDIKEMTIT